MPADPPAQLPHFILRNTGEAEPFRSPREGRPRYVPRRNRPAHGRQLLAQLEAVKAGERAEPDPVLLEEEVEDGLQIEFVGFEDVELAFESLSRERSGIELLNVRQEGGATLATVFVPAGKLELFEKLIHDYLRERRGAKGQALDNQRLIDTIREIRAATIRALWADAGEEFPVGEDEGVWWEVWLPVRGNREGVARAFRRLAAAQGIAVRPGELTFPERTVMLARATRRQLARSVALLNLIAELRRAKRTAEFFDSLDREEQGEWVDNLVGRTSYAEPGPQVPYVCILDTGVNRGHPLIDPALHPRDVHTIDPAWGASDEEGHGTRMAGLALFGDLARVLEGNGPVRLAHRLESVKLLRRDGDNAGSPDFHGHLTTEAIARAEITDPSRLRVFSLAVTAEDHRDRGRPSAWSATLDRIAADVDGDGMAPRLIVAAAGNVHDLNAWAEYPHSITTNAIHDPGQAWNVLTVGAYTRLIHITERDAEEYRPVAPPGGLSPFTTASATWQPIWPLKPDIVMEGGNAARDRFGAVGMASLALLTTHHQPQRRLFATANATSAATQLTAAMAAEVISAYPELWPESTRALLVHSARWTDEMKRTYLPTDGAPTKADYARLLRHCGFGVPDVHRAIWSARNSLTLVVEAGLRPFARDGSRPATLREMHLHRLPWPEAELEALGETIVEMRVTLSYFIEPNPSNRGRSRYRYESHGLRFEVRRPHESVQEFRARVNRAARDEEESTPVGGDDPGWLIGKQNRHRGSLHSDIWRGTAADLAQRGVLAVYPALGWWKTRTRLGRWDKVARYALVVSIHAPEVEVDLYTPIANAIGIPIVVEE